MQDRYYTDADYFARKKSQQIWARYLLKGKGVARWILFCNFFFGVLPGILFFVSSVRISQEEGKQMTNVLPDFNRAVSWFGILFVLFPMAISVFQIFKMHRLISLRMTRTFLIGQVVGFVFYMCSFSNKILESFHWFPKKSTFLLLVIILLTLVMGCVASPYIYYLSEAEYFRLPINQQQERLRFQRKKQLVKRHLCKK